MYLSVVPIRTYKNARGPEYLKWRYGRGLDIKWSLKDFGNEIPFALIATPHKLNIPHIPLSDIGINTKWIDKAANPTERMVRTLGVAFAMQSGIDRPDVWLGRDIHFGFDTLPAYDKQMQWAEYEAKLLRFGEWVMRGRYWVSDITGRILPVFAGGALPATDAFTNTNGTALTTHSASWTYNNTGFTAQTFAINTNAVHPTTSGSPAEVAAHWNADTFNDDHYSLATVANLAAGVYVGLSIRCATGATMTFYDYISDSLDASYLAKTVTGTYTQLGSTGSVFTTSLAIRLEATGTGIRPMRTGATADIGIQTDSAITSGYAGIAGYSTSTGARIDTWEGGNLTAPAVTAHLFNLLGIGG